MSELFDAIDALVASRAPLPPPDERRRLRKAHGLTVEEVATALKVRRATVSGWEAGKTEPRPPERDAYARLLQQLAELYPPPAAMAVPAQDTAAPAMSPLNPNEPAAPAAAAAPAAQGTPPPPP
ncbi:helix-turn-helix transcriptional regulator, partial [Streptomyces sp. H28]|uniref:helix-turn-helix domain-containing protein n=1 Tax=Streptomyces sp. H28 TaxID=2775865 RepID=UPI00177DD333